MSHYWICGSTRHQWEAYHYKKDTSCLSCGGDYQSLRVCPISWRTKHGRDGSRRSTSVGSKEALPSLKEGWQIRPMAKVAVAIQVFDLTREVKQVCSTMPGLSKTANSLGSATADALLAGSFAGAGGCPVETLGTRTWDGLMALRTILASERDEDSIVLPSLLSLSGRDMLLAFDYCEQRGLALVDTGSTSSYVCPKFLKLVNAELVESTRQSVITLADGSKTVTRGFALIEISISRKWPRMRILVSPLPL